MSKIFVERPNGERVEIQSDRALTLMEVIRANGIDDLLALCGGGCACGTCQVYVDQKYLDQLPPIGEEERELLDSLQNCKRNSRLSCRIQAEEIPDGLVVRVAPQ